MHVRREPESSDAQSRQTARSQRSARAKSKRAPHRKLSLRTRIRNDRSRLIMVIPMLVLFLLFTYLPILGNIVAFLDYSPYSGFFGSAFVGFDNFVRVLADSGFWRAVSNTVVITVVQLVFYFPLPIILAIVLNSVLNERVRTIIQSIVYLPHFFSWVIVVTIFQQIFGGAGIINQILRANGAEPIEIMTNPDVFLALLTSQTIWKDAGWGIVLFLAALAAINSSLYEAAAVDGASRWRRLWHITLPGIRSTIVLLLILRLGDALTVGFEQMLLQRDAVGVATAEVLDTFVYYEGVQYGDWSFAAAAGLIKGIVSLVLVLGANKIAHIFGEDGIYRR
ncbi:ABC transporter permease subunit [Microbacterium sp. MPKO10]|uniref:ABC transporter permease n=1 Tax=Microbacterium sp. MPKO10 TaxID=2989818 RepID=UPI002235F0F7|nr:ABC transporter permease subunit [Microbacterium sp. MPKO10]